LAVYEVSVDEKGWSKRWVVYELSVHELSVDDYSIF
jgi:hypothetical protein